MNQSGRYVIAYPQDDPFGPFTAVIGTTNSRRIAVGSSFQLGMRSDPTPLEPAVASDGRVALGWSVRRALHRGTSVAFGRDLAELPQASGARWRVRRVLAATVGYDPSDESTAPDVTFAAADRVLEAWTIDTHTGSRLVLGRQEAVGGPLRTRSVLRTTASASLQTAGLATDRRGRPIVLVNLSPVENATPLISTLHPKKETPVALTTTAAGQLERPELLRRGCDAEDLASRPSGQAAIAMVCDVAAKSSQIWVSERSPHARFRPAIRISARGIDGVFPTVSITKAGRVCVVWDRVVGSAKHYDANIVRTEVSCSAPGRRFTRPRWSTGRYPTQLNAPRLLEGPSGLALVRGRKNEQVVVQRVLAHGHLGPVVALSGVDVRNQTVAVDDRGRAVATWDASIGGKNRPEARIFDLP